VIKFLGEVMRFKSQCDFGNFPTYKYVAKIRPRQIFQRLTYIIKDRKKEIVYGKRKGSLVE